MDLDSLKNAITGFLTSGIINESENAKLNLDILFRKASLGYSRETEFELYKYYMDNLDKIKTNSYITYILNSAVTFNFNYKLSFLINQLLL